jgi:decaprenylphospho-beta-D-ribofuranose 2-oxidase
MSEPELLRLTGWGRTTASFATVRSAAGVDDVVSLVRSAGARGLLPRGLGRSYGDAAQNAGGLVLSPYQPDRPVDLDPDTGLVRMSAGTSIHRALLELLPRGRTLPVLPGTACVTLGGAVAADVHGKNHQADGSIGSWVRRLDLVDGTGEVRALTAHDTPQSYWATVGGMGLTGVITDVTLETLPVTSARLVVRTRRLPALPELMDAMASSTSRYQVAWVDAAAGRAFGRGILEEAEHDYRPGPLEYPSGGRQLVAPRLPANVVAPSLVQAANRVRWHRAPSDRHRLVDFRAYFHQLDGLGSWPRLYGPAGFLQWQFAVPDSAGSLIEPWLHRLVRSGCVPALVVLKRLGPQNAAPLSFPRPGWTVAVDLAASSPRVDTLLGRLDLEVAAAGGRVYLAKDTRLAPPLLQQMYPRLPAWRSARRELDPRGVFSSDLGRRLGLS